MSGLLALEVGGTYVHPSQHIIFHSTYNRISDPNADKDLFSKNKLRSVDEDILIISKTKEIIIS